MSIELDVDGIAAAESFQFDEAEKEVQNSHLSQKIYSPQYYPSDFKHNAAIIDQRSSEINRTDILVKDELEIVTVRDESPNDREAGWGAEASFGYSWGGNDGSRYEGSFRVEGHDSHGNYVEGSATQRSDGSGEANVRGGHDSSDKN